jgi:hypothetical protein
MSASGNKMRIFLGILLKNNQLKKALIFLPPGAKTKHLRQLFWKLLGGCSGGRLKSKSHPLYVYQLIFYIFFIIFLRFGGTCHSFLYLFFFIQDSRYFHTLFIHKHSLRPICSFWPVSMGRRKLCEQRRWKRLRLHKVGDKDDCRLGEGVGACWKIWTAHRCCCGAQTSSRLW